MGSAPIPCPPAPWSPTSVFASNETENLPPEASFEWSPLEPVTGQAVEFRDAGSRDPDGTIIGFVWDFGDGEHQSGDRFVHIYTQDGSYHVVLFVIDETGGVGCAAATVIVLRGSPIPLVERSHPAGFRVPVPWNWTVQEDVPFQGSSVELVLLGPLTGLVQTTIIIDTGVDPEVRETSTYLEGLYEESLAQAREEDSLSYVVQSAMFRTLSRHAAVTFVIARERGVVVDRTAVIVSEAHHRYWILALHTAGSLYVSMNVTFERMLEGFQITLPEPLPLWIQWALLGTALTALVAAYAFRVRRRRRSSQGEALRHRPTCPSGEALG